MKLYQTPGGVWTGTQADWKAAMKDEGATGNIDDLTVEVPTDKAGLMEFLTFHGVNTLHPCGTPIVAHVVQNVEPVDYYSKKSVTLDEIFEAAPLAHQLTLASLALESARVLVKEATRAHNT